MREKKTMKGEDFKRNEQAREKERLRRKEVVFSFSYVK